MKRVTAVTFIRGQSQLQFIGAATVFSTWIDNYNVHSKIDIYQLIVVEWRRMTKPNWVNIGWKGGLLPDGTKPLSEPRSTYHQRRSLTLTEE